MARPSPHKARFVISLVSKCDAGVRLKDHMRAIVIEKPGGPEVLRLEDLKRLVPPEEEPIYGHCDAAPKSRDSRIVGAIYDVLTRLDGTRCYTQL